MIERARRRLRRGFRPCDGAQPKAHLLMESPSSSGRRSGSSLGPTLFRSLSRWFSGRYTALH